MKRLEGRPEDDKFIQKILLEWLDERDETLLLAMETNVEKRSDFGGKSLWGEKDHRGNRIMLCTPWFNYLDFVSDLIDYVYSKVSVSCASPHIIPLALVAWLVARLRFAVIA